MRLLFVCRTPRRQWQQSCRCTQPQPAPVVEPVALPATTGVPLRIPVAALMTYAKADGSFRVRRLRIYSRTCKAGRSHALHGRQEGERITKQFLLSGISRLELAELSPPLILTTSESITRWLEHHLQAQSARLPAEQQLPVVLCRDFGQARIESTIQAWIYQSDQAIKH